MILHSPIDDGSGFIGVRWARHLDFGHGISLQLALSMAVSVTLVMLLLLLLIIGGGVVIAVAARRLLRSDTATRSRTQKETAAVDERKKKTRDISRRLSRVLLAKSRETRTSEDTRICAPLDRMAVASPVLARENVSSQTRMSKTRQRRDLPDNI